MGSTLGQRVGTGVLFAKFQRAFIFASEQFWGRAARAPSISKEIRGARYFWRNEVRSQPSTFPPVAFRLSFVIPSGVESLP
jgi:hypothetical protein